jgi:hypothetical protein
MNNVIAYDMVSSTDPKELIQLIDDQIREGWQAYGAPVTKSDFDRSTGQEIVIYFQALVKYSG